jgi:hypothetical protein
MVKSAGHPVPFAEVFGAIRRGNRDDSILVCAGIASMRDFECPRPLQEVPIPTTFLSIGVLADPRLRLGDI